MHLHLFMGHHGLLYIAYHMTFFCTMQLNYCVTSSLKRNRQPVSAMSHNAACHAESLIEGSFAANDV